jgi:hypothetical protein
MNTYDLEDIELGEISCVDAPANQHAAVVLFKHSGYKRDVKPETEGLNHEGDRSVTVEELTEKMEELQRQVADLTKEAADAKAYAESLTKSAAEAGLDVEDGKIVKRAVPEYVEVDGEKIEKSLVPAAVLRTIEKQAADIAKMKQEAEEAELAKRGAAELPNLAGTALAKGRLLAQIESDPDLLKSLMAANAAMAENFTEKGHTNVDDGASPSAKLEKLAKAHAEAEGVSYHSAYAEVTKSGIGAQLLTEIRNTAN